MNQQQLKSYLKRIGLVSFTPGEPSVELLDRLTEAHQLMVPFEDLDSHDFKKPVSLDLGDLYDKIVKEFPNAKLIGDATTPLGKVYRTLEAVKGGYETAMAL